MAEIELQVKLYKDRLDTQELELQRATARSDRLEREAAVREGALRTDLREKNQRLLNLEKTLIELKAMVDELREQLREATRGH